MARETDACLTFLVESGPHAGTVERLPPGRYRIGSGAGADIVLSDPALDPVHALLEIDSRGVRVEALTGPLTVAGDPGALEPGQERRLTTPATLDLGEARIVLRRPREPGWRRHTRYGLLTVAVLAAGGLAVLAGQTRAVESGHPPLQFASLAPEGAFDTPPVPEPPRRPGLEEARAALSERLAAHGLNGLTVETPDGRLLVRGALPPDAMPRWREVQSWFDGVHARTAPLVSEVRAADASARPRLHVSAVWTGDTPYLIAADGAKYFVGARLAGGWSVAEISPARVVLGREGGERFVVALPAP